jgi:type 1 glutamine amidotransferase
MFHKRPAIAFTGLVLLLGLPSIAMAADDGFKSIFDGKTLNGWDGDPKFWRVEEGAITGETKDENDLTENTYLVWKDGEVDDFELTLEIRIFSGNSGVQFRSFTKPDFGKYVLGGYQADFEAGDVYAGNLWGQLDRPANPGDLGQIFAERGQKVTIGEDHKPKVTGQTGDYDALNEKIDKLEWNKYRIVAKGYNFQNFINDTLMTDVTDEDKAERRRGGPLALQLHVGPPMKVQFRNIMLKRLPMEDVKKVVMIAGPASHGHMEHEHYAGCRLLADCLNKGNAGVYAAVYRNGWPKDPTAFDNANEIVMYCDGGEGHMVMGHLKEVDALVKKGVGVACLHYGVEVPKGEAGDDFLSWIGGYFEMNWSVNPHWTADFKTLPTHPITSGVKPFAIQDEWYYHMRFAKDMAGVTPILTAIPPKETLDRPDGPHEGNKDVRAEAGKPQHMAWAFERKDGGRGFGFTGGHFHYNWANDQFRKLVLNALVWTAKAEVPKEGVKSATPTVEELEKNQDEPKPEKFDLDKIKKDIERWNKAS